MKLKIVFLLILVPVTLAARRPKRHCIACQRLDQAHKGQQAVPVYRVPLNGHCTINGLHEHGWYTTNDNIVHLKRGGRVRNRRLTARGVRRGCTNLETVGREEHVVARLSVDEPIKLPTYAK